MSTFVDSSAWFAAGNRKDRYNRLAVDLLGRSGSLVTTNLVIVETWLLINARIGFDEARSFWDRMRRSPVEAIQVTSEDHFQAWAISERFRDQKFSIVDCTSFVVMERLGIDRAISFDNDFVIFRYGPNRDQAFEVLR